MTAVLRRLAFVLGLALAVPAAAAQPNPGGFSPSTEPPPGETMRRPEHLTARPSGFWTSTRPAVGGAYRYRIMGMGAVALLIATFVLVRTLRRASAERVAK
jgi:hypothetical protein